MSLLCLLGAATASSTAEQKPSAKKSKPGAVDKTIMKGANKSLAPTKVCLHL
jgi:hypothetical protein